MRFCPQFALPLILIGFSISISPISIGPISIGQAQDSAKQLVYPIDVTVDDKGVIFVADLKLPGVWKLSEGNTEVIYQGKKQFRTPLNAIRCLCFGNGKLLAGDSATTGVYDMDGGQPKKVHPDRIGIPTAIAVTGSGDLLVADLDLRRIWKIPAAGGEAKMFAEVPAARGLAVDAEGRVWVVSHGNDHVLRLSADGKQREVIVPGRAFRFPHHIAVNAQGDAFVADGYAKAIWKIPNGGKPEKLVQGGPLRNPVGLAIRGEKLLVADPHAKSVFEVDAKGDIKKLAGPK